MSHSMLLLVTVLLPSALALTVALDNKGEAVFELQEMDLASLNMLKGGQGIVRFAKVKTIRDGYIFKNGDEVALKIAYPDEVHQLVNEKKAHDIIRNNGSIEGVVKAEKSLALCSNFEKEKFLCLPEEFDNENKLLILIMERMGKDMAGMKNKLGEIQEDELDTIYNRLYFILAQLETIGVVHGDIKPQNILFKKSTKVEAEEIETRDKVKDGIKLTDFGLAVFTGSNVTDCAGDDIYISPNQYILQRAANFRDVAVSGAYTIVFMGASYLPWMQFIDKSFKKIYPVRRATLAKDKFNKDPLDFLKNSTMSQGLQEKIMNTIKNATKEEDELQNEKIQNELNEYAVLIAENP